jgi:DNA-binding CsgD family transcriptional regulator
MLMNLIERHSLRHHKKLKKLSAPLDEMLGISNFSYYSIDDDGKFCFLSNNPAQAEFYYANRLYSSNPYLVHPQLLRSGCILEKAVVSPELFEISLRKFYVGNLFMVQKRDGNRVEGYLFGDSEENTQLNERYLRNLPLLNRFSAYFKRELAEWIAKIEREDYNLKEAIGTSFLEGKSTCLLSSHEDSSLGFLKRISGLSNREEQCLECYQNGHSAQSTAALLGLSQRTVEHYFENMKRKLGVSSKRDLLE